MEEKIPRHVTIIMDGNGRWAQKQGKERVQGHYEGVESVRVCCEFAAEKGIEYLSIFAFSEENWNRPQTEVEALMALMLKSVLAEKETFLKNGMKFRVIGDRSRLSSGLIESIEMLETATAGCTGTTVIVMLSYSGKWDIMQAARKYAAEVLEAQRQGNPAPDLTDESFSGLLSTAGIPDPDLMIRTSGEQRISNYMLWQCAYTEFYFTDTLWPDFRKEEFALALKSYSERDRRFGKIKL